MNTLNFFTEWWKVNPFDKTQSAVQRRDALVRLALYISCLAVLYTSDMSMLVPFTIMVTGLYFVPMPVSYDAMNMIPTNKFVSHKKSKWNKTPDWILGYPPSLEAMQYHTRIGYGPVQGKPNSWMGTTRDPAKFLKPIDVIPESLGMTRTFSQSISPHVAYMPNNDYARYQPGHRTLYQTYIQP